MKLQLFKKFFFTTAAIIMFSLASMMMIMTFVFNRYLANSNYETLGKTCRAVADFAARDFSGEADGLNYSRSLYYIMSNLGGVSDFDVFISDTEGIVRMCSCTEWEKSGSCDHTNTIISADFIERARNGDCYELNMLGIYQNPRYVSGVAIRGEGDTVPGIVIATAPMSALRTLTQTVIKLYLISAVVPLALMFFAIYAMTYRLTKPMKQMSQAARAMAKGDFSKRIPVTSDDEIGELAVSFNQMTNSLVQLEGMRRSFIANVSHELKTPMTTISGFIDGIIDGTIEPEKQQYYLNIVSDEVKRLSRLVQSMLSLAKLESGEFALKFAAFNFRELLLNVVIAQEQRIEKRRLNITGLDDLSDIAINADRDLIHQVVYNLVDNAVKFTDPDGTIDFRLRVEGNRLFFSIKNTGKGIPSEALPYVFERFYKADKSRSANKNGTGLGLYIAKTIVRTHGGNITVASVENEYTVFEVELPLAR